MTPHHELAVRLVSVLLAAECVASARVLASPPETTGETRAASAEVPPNEESVPAESQEADAPVDLAINNPGSITERSRRDEEPKEYLFPTPGVSELLKPWYEWKAELDEKYGLRFGISAIPGNRSDVLSHWSGSLLTSLC